MPSAPGSASPYSGGSSFGGSPMMGHLGGNDISPFFSPMPAGGGQIGPAGPTNGPPNVYPGDRPFGRGILGGPGPGGSNPQGGIAPGGSPIGGIAPGSNPGPVMMPNSGGIAPPGNPQGGIAPPGSPLGATASGGPGPGPTGINSPYGGPGPTGINSPQTGVGPTGINSPYGGPGPTGINSPQTGVGPTGINSPYGGPGPAGSPLGGTSFGLPVPPQPQQVGGVPGATPPFNSSTLNQSQMGQAQPFNFSGGG